MNRGESSRNDSFHAPATASESSERSGLREYLGIARANKWVILGLTLLGAVAATVWSSRQTKLYEAICSVEFDPSAGGAGAGDREGSAAFANFLMTQEFLETQNQVIRSRKIAELVVKRLRLSTDRTFLKTGGIPLTGNATVDAAEVIRSRLAVSLVLGTRIVQIRYRDPSPDRATRIADTIAKVYEEKTIDDRLGSTVTALRNFREQLGNLRNDLSASERALNRFKEENSILSMSMEHRKNEVIAEITHLSAKLREARDEHGKATARLARVRAMIAGEEIDERSAAFSETSNAIQELRAQLREKEGERAAVAAEHGPQYPQMRVLDRQIELVRDRLSLELRAIVRSAEADVREIESLETNVKRRLAEADQIGDQLGRQDVEYSQLRSERENTAKLYDQVLQRATETDLAQVVRNTHVKPLDSALTPTRHVSPRFDLNIFVGSAVGLAMGILLAFLLSRMDRRIKSAEDVEQLGVHVLGVLPLMDMNAVTDRGVPLHRETLVHDQPMSAVAENCRSIRTNLTFMAVDSPLRTIVVTSSHPQEGKTTVTTNLGIAFAQSGKRVLIVDTDLRRPRVHQAFRMASRRGATNVLVGDMTLAEAKLSTEIPGLDVLVCGLIPPNPTELLHHRRFQELVAEAKEQYDLVLFDSPPLAAVTDAAVIAPQVDAVVLVSRAGSTTRDALRSALRQLSNVHARVAGAVLNALDPKAEQYGYGGAYYQARDGYYSSPEATTSTPGPTNSSGS